MGVSGPSLLIESTDSMILLIAAYKPKDTYNLPVTAGSHVPIFFLHIHERYM